MKSPILEKLRECCDNTKYYLVIYDGANTPHLPVLVCNQCIGELAFQQFIITQYQLTKKTNVEQILKDFQGGKLID